MIINLILVALFVLSIFFAIVNYHFGEMTLLVMNLMTMVLVVLCFVERWRG